MAYQPKSYRKFVATAATATLVASAVAPAAAAGFTDVADRYKEAVDFVVSKGAKGKSETQFGVYENITRVDAAVLLANVLELDTEGSPVAGFTDVPARAVGAVNALKAAGITNGKSDTKFGAYDLITRGELAVWIQKGFGLKGEADVKFTDVASQYTEAVTALVANKITEGKTETQFGTNQNAMRGDFAIFLHRAANVDATPEVPATPEVVGVSAINASELKVTFNTAVNSTAQVASNYELKINNVTVPTSHIIDISLSEDGKTATLLLDQANVAFQNGDKYVIQTNDAITSKDGKKLEKFVSNEATFSETAAPSLVSVAKSGDNLLLTFDRPVNANKAGNDVTLVKIDGIEIGSKDLKPVHAKQGNTEILGKAGVYQYTIAIENTNAKTEAKKVGTHEVVIFDVADTAGAYQKVASVLTGSYTVSDQVTTPEVTGVEAVNANRFFLYTNTTVDLSGAVITVNKGTHEFKVDSTAYNGSIDEANITVADAAVGTYKGKPGIWVVVTDNNGTVEENPLYRSGETSVNLSVVIEKFTADGLIGKKSTQTVTLTKNNTKPVVETTAVGADEKSLVVTFTNDLVSLTGGALALTEGNDFVVRDKDGIIIEGFSAAVSGKTITFTKGSDDLKDAPYTVEFKEGKFKNQENRTSVPAYLANTVKNDAFTVSVGKEAASNFKYSEYRFDTTPSTGNTVVDVGNNTITFKFNQRMSDSARNVANYTLDGKALPAGTTADFVGDRQTVRIVFPSGTFKTSTQYKLGVTTNVTTEAGSIIVGSLQTKAPAELVFGVTDNVKPELASAVYYVGTENVTNQTRTNQIEVTFDEAVQIEPTKKAANDFVVEINGSKYEVASVAQALSGDNTERKLVLTLSESINVSQAATISIVPESEQTGTALEREIAVVDLAGNKAKEGSLVTLAGNNVKYNAALASEVTAELSAAKTAIEDDSNYDLDASDDATAARTKVLAAINNLSEVSGKGFTVNLTQTGFTAADPTVADGEYKFTVTLSKFGQTIITDEVVVVIPQ